jgi:hypothetical protein
MVFGLWSTCGNRWIVSDSGFDFKTESKDVAEAAIKRMNADGALGIEVREYVFPSFE